MDFGIERVTNYYLNIEQYKWYTDDLKQYLTRLGENAPFIVRNFAKLWYWGRLTRVQTKQYGIKNKQDDYETWEDEISDRLEYSHFTEDEVFAYELDFPNNPELQKLLNFCLYSENNFDKWVLEGVSEEKKYPPINNEDLPLVKKSYKAFIYWLFRKMKKKKGIGFFELDIIEFVKEMSKLKIDSDYKQRVHEIIFCENVVEEWNRIVINFNDTQEIAPRDFSFLEIFKDKIKLCEDWKYYPKMDSLGNIVNF